MRTYQNIEIDGVDIGLTPAKKGSRFCNEGKWENFINPLLPNDCRDQVFVEMGCNAGLFLKMAKEKGFRNVVGVEQSTRTYRSARKYRDSLGLDYEILNRMVGEHFDYDEIPVADVTLMANFHYYLPINDFYLFLEKLRFKTCYCLVVSADIKEKHWRARPRMADLKHYFSGWEEVGSVYPISIEKDSFPRKMWSVLFKSPSLQRRKISELHWKKPSLGKVDLVKRIASNEPLGDIKKLRYYEEANNFMGRKGESRVIAYVKERIENLRSVKENGMKTPIFARSDGKVADGRHRILLLKELGYSSIITAKI